MAYISGTVYDDTDTAVGGRTVRAYRRDTGAFLGERSSASGSVAADASYANVSLLLHGDGTNGSTTIPDSSVSPATVTTYGNAAISTTQSKFGGSSLYFDGTGDYLTIPGGDAFAMGTGDFTIEAWVRPASTSGVQAICNIAYDGSGQLFFGIIYGALTVYHAGGSILAGSSAPAADAWSHIALTRASGTLQMWIEGTQVGTVSFSTSLSCPNPVSIGAGYAGAYPFAGYVDEVRITKGVARYTSSFTPPAAAFSDTPFDLATGGYCITTSYTGEVNVICLDDSSGTTYNDMILRTTPV